MLTEDHPERPKEKSKFPKTTLFWKKKKFSLEVWDRFLKNGLTCTVFFNNM